MRNKAARSEAVNEFLTSLEALQPVLSPCVKLTDMLVLLRHNCEEENDVAKRRRKLYKGSTQRPRLSKFGSRGVPQRPTCTAFISERTEPE
jgi:hypothetical protein